MRKTGEEEECGRGKKGASVSSFGIDRLLQDANERKGTVSFSIVKSVANHKVRVDVPSNVLWKIICFRTSRFSEEDYALYAFWLSCGELLNEVLESDSSVKNVFHNQNIPPFNVRSQVQLYLDVS